MAGCKHVVRHMGTGGRKRVTQEQGKVTHTVVYATGDWFTRKLHKSQPFARVTDATELKEYIEGMGFEARVYQTGVLEVMEREQQRKG